MTFNKNNILIIAGGAPRYLSVAKHINKLVKIFDALHKNVCVLSPYDASVINIKKINIYTIKTSRNRYESFFKTQFQELVEMHKIFEHHKIGIVFFAFGHDLNLIPILFSKIMGKKVVLRSDGRPSFILEKYYKNQSIFKKYFFKIIESLNYRLADALVSECSYMLKENNQDLPKKSGVANLPVDLDSFSRKKSFDQRRYDLGYFGTLDQRRGVVHLINAINMVIKNKNTLSVLIGGNGDLKEEIDHMILKNNLGKNIQIVDWIPDENFPDYLNSIKVFVLPSSLEGLPNIVLEAMACGTVVPVRRLEECPE